MKSNKGFSLVELIVVIAIMAIIAGVAIPVYSGYITKANEGADESVYTEAVHAAQLAVMETQFKDVEITISAASGTLSISAAEGATGAAAKAAAQVAKVVGATDEDSDGTYELELKSDSFSKSQTVTFEF